MAQTSPDDVDIEFSEFSALVSHFFPGEAASELFQWAEDRDLTGDLAKVVARLGERLGGHLVVSADTGSNPVPLESLKVLVGRRYHLKLGRSAWLSLAATLPLLVGVAAASVTPTDVASAISALLVALTSNLERLSPFEWRAYLAAMKVHAVTKNGATRDEVAAELFERGHHQSELEELNARLDAMIFREILRVDSSGRILPSL